MKKRWIALGLAAAMAVSMTACTSNTKNESGDSSNTADKKFTVGICQLATHPALDAATKGFREQLEKELPGQVEFKEQNAAGDSNTCTTIVNGFVASKVDLILANATASLQAATAATNTIPILGTSVTEYGVALNIKDFTGTVGTNVSGTSDLAPLAQQAAMWVCCIARRNPTASIRWIPCRKSWKNWATPANSTLSPAPTMLLPSPRRQRTPAMFCMSPPTTRWLPTPVWWTTSAAPPKFR